MSARDLGKGRVAKQKSTTEGRPLPNDSVEVRHLSEKVELSLVPPGTILDFGGAVAPSGYLVCDGSELDIASFPDLFAAIGTVWGTSDVGATKFNLPDMRGRVTRGHDNGAGRDPDAAVRGNSGSGNDTSITGQVTGDNVGSPQEVSTSLPQSVAFTSSLQDTNHTHTFGTGTQSANHTHPIQLQAQPTGAGNGVPQSATGIPTGTPPTGTISASHTHAGGTGGVSASHGHSVSGGGDLETRMKNVYTNKIIKI